MGCLEWHYLRLERRGHTAKNGTPGDAMMVVELPEVEPRNGWYCKLFWWICIACCTITRPDDVIQQLPCSHDYVIWVGGLGRHDDKIFHKLSFHFAKDTKLVNDRWRHCTFEYSCEVDVHCLHVVHCLFANYHSPLHCFHGLDSILKAIVEAIRQRFHKVQCLLFTDRHSINYIYALVCNLPIRDIHEIGRLICN